MANIKVKTHHLLDYDAAMGALVAVEINCERDFQCVP